jgi:hypothetical protein
VPKNVAAKINHSLKIFKKMAELNPNTPPTPTPTPPADAPEIYKLEFDKSELEKIAIDKGYPNLEQAIEDKELQKARNEMLIPTSAE